MDFVNAAIGAITQSLGKEAVVDLIYPETGHLIQPAFSPFCRRTWFKEMGTATELYTYVIEYYRLVLGYKVLINRIETVDFFFSGAVIDWGGEKLAHAKAQIDSWPKIIEFLHNTLKEENHVKPSRL
jgi:hypothetical protein